MHLLKKIIALSLIVLCVGCNQKPKQSKTVLNVGMTPDVAPFAYYRENHIVGFEADLIKLIAKDLGYADVHLKDIEFADLIPGLIRGDIDVALSGMSPSPERLRWVDFSDSYYQMHSVLLTDQDQTAINHDFLVGKTMGVQASCTQEILAQDMAISIPHMTLILANNGAQLVELLKLHRIDAVLMEEYQARSFTAADPSLHYTVLKDQPISDWAIALPHNSPLKERINQSLSKLRASGQIHALVCLWNERSEERLSSLTQD